MPLLRPAFAVLLAAGTLLSTAPAVAAEPPVRTVANGLDNPRGLTFGPDGTLYVAEAGRGGAGPCHQGAEGRVCFGATGAITEVVPHGRQIRLARGLPSLAAPGGASSTGPSDVTVGGDGRVLFTVGLGSDPALRGTTPQLAAMGKLDLVNAGGQVRAVADPAAYEATANADGVRPPDSNPNSALATGAGVLVVDAGGNSLLRTGAHGRFSTVATFPGRVVAAPPGIPNLPPKVTMQAVPTSVVRGPDGALYVGELTGFPFPAGQARVWRIAPGRKPAVYATGFTTIIDLAFGPGGRLYVLQITRRGLLSKDPLGALLRVDRDGSHHELVPGTLHSPGGLAIRGSAAYVADCSTCAGTGRVVRIGLPRS